MRSRGGYWGKEHRDGSIWVVGGMEYIVIGGFFCVYLLDV